MTDKFPKAKYKIGQEVYLISNGYISREIIKGMFLDKHGELMYSIYKAEFGDMKYSFDNDDVHCEDNLYPTKDALIKSIKDTNFDD